MISFSKGNLFESGRFDIITNTINCCGAMGAGIALEYKTRYPDMFRDYKKKCQNNEYFPGHIYEYKVDSALTIINFTTKDHWRSPSKLCWIESGLDELREYLKNVSWENLVAVPRLGCGLGGLKWSEVRPLIVNHLKDLKHNITIFEN